MKEVKEIVSVTLPKSLIPKLDKAVEALNRKSRSSFVTMILQYALDEVDLEQICEVEKKDVCQCTYPKHCFVCGASISMTCSNCGSPLPRFCSDCGRSFHLIELDGEELVEKQSEVESTHKFGYVYLVSSSRPNYFKIGASKQPEARLSGLKYEFPYTDEIVHLIEADRPQKAESLLHKKFAEKHDESEWFYLDESDIEYITSLAKFEQGQFFIGLSVEYGVEN